MTKLIFYLISLTNTMTISFTIETEVNNKLNFLDMTVIKKNNTVITNWYQKPTHSGRTLNYRSNHPKHMKTGIVKNMLNRMIKLSNPQFVQNNLKNIHIILGKNDYPEKFIDKIYKHMMYPKKKQSICRNHTTNGSITLPYVPKIDNDIKEVCKKYNLNLIYKICNKFPFSQPKKDHLSPHQQFNVVYQIKCLGCNSYYIGQTKRKLKIRLMEHQRTEKKLDIKGGISEHTHHTGHRMDYDNVKILDHESNYYRRIISESIFIKIHNNVNTQVESNIFTSIYNNILDKIKDS